MRFCRPPITPNNRSNTSPSLAAAAASSPDMVCPRSAASCWSLRIPSPPSESIGTRSAPAFPKYSIAAALFNAGSWINDSLSAIAMNCSSGLIFARSSTLSPSAANLSAAPGTPAAASAIPTCILRTPFSSVPMSVPESLAAYPREDTASALMPVRWAMSSTALPASANPLASATKPVTATDPAIAVGRLSTLLENPDSAPWAPAKPFAIPVPIVVATPLSRDMAACTWAMPLSNEPCLVAISTYA